MRLNEQITRSWIPATETTMEIPPLAFNKIVPVRFGPLSRRLHLRWTNSFGAQCAEARMGESKSWVRLRMRTSSGHARSANS